MNTGQRRRLFVFVMLGVCLWARGATGDVDRIGVRMDDREGHGWAVVSAERGDLLLYLPSRGSDADSTAGTTQIVTGLRHKAERVASFGSKVWVVVHRQPGEGFRRVLRASVGVGPGGRAVGGETLVTLPPLPGEGDLEGAVGTSLGPVVLTRTRLRAADDGDAGGRRELRALFRSTWHTVELPEQVRDAPGGVAWLVRLAGRPAVVVRDTGSASARVWICELAAHRVEAGENDGDEPGDATSRWAVSGSWTSEDLPLGEPISNPEWQAFVGLDGQVVHLERGRDGRELLPVRVRLVRRGGVVERAVVDDVPKRFDLVPLHGSGLLGFVWWEASEQEGERGRRGFGEIRMVEVGVVGVEGVVFRGAAQQRGIVELRDLQGLLGVLIALALVAGLFVLRDPIGENTVPEGVVPGDPARRVAAGVLDVLPVVGLWLVVRSTPVGVTLEQAGDWVVGRGWGPIVVCLGFTMFHTTISEWATGRSLGKSLLGLRVVDIREQGDRQGSGDRGEGEAEGQDTHPGDGPDTVRFARPVFWQSAVRNFIRWLVFPSVLMFLEPTRRHIGDLMSRTMVRSEGEESDKPT